MEGQADYVGAHKLAHGSDENNLCPQRVSDILMHRLSSERNREKSAEQVNNRRYGECTEYETGKDELAGYLTIASASLNQDWYCCNRRYRGLNYDNQGNS